MPNLGSVYEEIVYNLVIMEPYRKINTEPLIFKRVRNY